jgi:fatty-acyl-CoA synthase
MLPVIYRGSDLLLAANDTDADVAGALPGDAAPTPTSSGIAQRFCFPSLTDAIDYAATGATGMNFYNERLELTQALPYRDLRAAAIALARRLRGVGVRREERVALIADTGPDFIVAFAACQYGGMIPVPMPLPSAFGGRDAYVAMIRHMLTCAGATAALTPQWVMPWLHDAADGLGLKLCGTVAQLAALPEAPVDPVRAEPDRLSYLQFSSGSTRVPAGIAVTHRALMSNTAGIAGCGLAVVSGDRAVSWLPFYHDMGLVGFLLATIVAQMSVDFMPTRDFARRPLNWLRLMDMNGGSVTYSSSFGYDLCMKRASSGKLPDLDLSTWRVAGIGGDMIRPHVLEQFAETFAPLGFDAKAFVPSYGLAEATLAVTFREPGKGLCIDRVDIDQLEHFRRAAPPTPRTGRSRDFITCGKVLPGHAVQIRSEAGALLGMREVGRVFVKGPSLMTGYDRRPEETAVALVGGWLDTGDLGYLVGDELVITGRSKEIIIINGRNLWPQDLEYTAEQVDGLRQGDAAAFSIEREDHSEEQVVLLVQCRMPDPAARRSLVLAITANLRKIHGVSAVVELVPKNTLPMTSSGKLRRRSARAAYLAGEYKGGMCS